MATIAKQLGQRLREIRKAKGFSQDRLALESGIDRSYVGRIERGEVNITIDIVERLAKTLSISAKQLLPD